MGNVPSYSCYLNSYWSHYCWRVAGSLEGPNNILTVCEEVVAGELICPGSLRTLLFMRKRRSCFTVLVLSLASLRGGVWATHGLRKAMNICVEVSQGRAQLGHATTCIQAHSPSHFPSLALATWFPDWDYLICVPLQPNPFPGD